MRRTLAVAMLALIWATPAAQGQEPGPRYKVGDTFMQEVVVTRKSIFRVAGLDVEKWAQYAITSSFTITKVDLDGSLVAEQTIQSGKLLDADPDMKGPVTTALEKAKGIKFEVTVRPNGEVSELKGLKDAIQVRTGPDVAVGQSLRLWSLLDSDAWKELNGLTFFQPEEVSPGAPPLKKWSRPAAHDWGPLGSWGGQTVYTRGGKQSGKPALTRFEYRHDLKYKTPEAGKDSNLPLKIVKSEFTLVTAAGVIGYHPTARKVAAAEEVFRVRGTVLASLAGIEVTIELEEQQGFRVTVPGVATPGPAR
jgi:hypothetical protein